MEHKGTVYFFTGLSGAGKTTVGSLFYQRLKNTKPNAVYLDGDEIRVAFGEDVGYTNDERLRWAGRIFRVCRLLSDQGIDVVCCSIAMFDTVRRWNREHIPNYKEIYIRVKKETLIQRNQKGLYTGGRNVVGVDLPFDEPQSPDLVLQNDGERTPLELVEEIEGRSTRISWSTPSTIPITGTCIIKTSSAPPAPPPSPGMCPPWWSRGGRWRSWGCGNGGTPSTLPLWGWTWWRWTCLRRPSACSGSSRSHTPGFVCGDFVSHTLHQPESYDYAYSRFTIHAINQKQERMLLGSMARALKPGGKFFIEVRSVHDPLYGKGEALERNAFFYDNHYRRFLVLDELTEALRQAGFRIEYAREQTGFAPYGTDDPPVTALWR